MTCPIPPTRFTVARRFTVIAAVALALSAPLATAAAQQPVSLRGFLAALADHPELRAAQATVRAAELQLSAARDPVALETSGGYTRLRLSDDLGAAQLAPGGDPGGGLTGSLPETSWQVSAALTFRPYPFGDTADLVAQRGLELETSRLELRDAQAALERRALEAALQLRLAARSTELAREGVDARLQAEGVLDNRVSRIQGANFDLLGDLLFYAPIAFGLAPLLNYLAIGSQFNSFKYPLYLLLTVPLALVGAIWLFYFTGTSLDIISILGVVMLIGLVTKNAILLLDVTLAETKNGMPLKDALLEAAEVRFRPILMTTTTVVVISLPLLLGLGEGSEFRYPLGLVILGGVLTSALLTFYVVPAAFYRFECHNYPAEPGTAPKTVAERESVRAEGAGAAVAPPRPSPSLGEGSS